ncbi:phospho-sugar mutase [Acholeplasma hippikon]|uniref:Phosphoglucomutase n=1 Tax=Acholeplasma hippikon TaxID=264636 RepID=A0A449BJC4_9MOLU|nr:phospho-sugar mutase [Acholeplasma hippikon]VEU82538.1 Phosphoglucomutase [Acholeplasma hippikon]
MSYQAVYQTWLNEPSLLAEEKQTLQQMNEKDIEESFYQEISFGTGGIRGLLGLGPNRINAYTIRRATLGLANYLIKNNKLNGVAISYDNRFGSREYAYEAAKVLAAKGIKSFIYSSLRPTPMLSFALRYFNASAGIMLTASHNPKEYNGYKVYNETGAQLNTYEATLVMNEISKIASPFNIETVMNELVHEIHDELDPIYLEEVKKIQIHNDKKTIKIVYSPLHGTGGTVIPKLLAETGYEVYPLKEQMIVDPAFSNTKSSNPEDSIAYERSIAYAKEIDADMVLVTDPDADRLGVAVKHNNEFVLINGNQTASLELYYLLTEKKQPDGFVYTTVVTSPLIKQIALGFNKKVGETLTGFKFIGEQAEKIMGKDNYLFGCEESYGSLVKDFVRDKDAVQAVFILSEIGNKLKQKGLTLVDYLDEIYQKFGYYVEHTVNISLKGIEGSKRIQAIMSYFRNNGLNIPSFKVENKIDYINGYVNPHDIHLPSSDVVKFENEDGFIIFRPSGTEPKLKIYFSTRKSNQKEAKQYIEKLVEEVQGVVAKI